MHHSKEVVTLLWFNMATAQRTDTACGTGTRTETETSTNSENKVATCFNWSGISTVCLSREDRGLGLVLSVKRVLFDLALPE